VLISYNPKWVEYLMNRHKIVQDLSAKYTKLTNMLFVWDDGYD